MHSSVYFACATTLAFYAYLQLSSAPSVTPKVTTSEIAHASRKLDPLARNDGHQSSLAPRATSMSPFA